MSYDIKKVQWFVVLVLQRNEELPERGFLFQFLRDVHAESYIGNSRMERYPELEEVLVEFNRLSPWEQGNVIYHLQPRLNEEVGDVAKEFWRRARLEDG